MPERLYIPTSSLNFDNIMSSESIAPVAFYAKRGYGFKRFEKVILNNLDNVILLYDQLPHYVISDEELESFPMVIEICKNSCSAKIEDLGDGIYLCDETIYINPFDTKIYFYSYEALRSAISRAKPSIESKLVNLYSNFFCVDYDASKRRKYAYGKVKDKPYNDSALKRDIKIDKLKGFLYAYIIAFNRSYEPSVVHLKMHFKQLINSLSAIINAPDYRMFSYGRTINSLYEAIRDDIARMGDIQGQVERRIQAKREQYRIENLDDILKKEDLYDIWRRRIEDSCMEPFEIKKFDFNFNGNKLEYLESYSQYLKYFVDKFQKKKKIPPEKLPTVVNDLISEIPGEEFKPFVVKLLNYYLDRNVQKDKFLADKYHYALEGGQLFKDEFGDIKKWEASESREYINSLLRNLNEYSAFDISSTKNQTLKSFAAFFQKGDIQIEKLEDYLVENGIGDLRIAFALWGIVFGFTEMPKTVTMDLFDSTDTQYKTAIYKSVYKDLFGIQLSGELCATAVSASVGLLPGDHLTCVDAARKSKDIGKDKQGNTSRKRKESTATGKSCKENSLAVQGEFWQLHEEGNFKRQSQSKRHIKSIGVFGDSLSSIDLMQKNSTSVSIEDNAPAKKKPKKSGRKKGEQ